uniref:Uncharacterized protein n=1 Tax=Meloidogyne enterolobii TaxID=390850 RepID=A0A6V7WWC4_MELEN|nr:unnamed protein product [Meloidogyne enterolobii]
MMKRTTLTTKEYSSIEEIPTTQIPSLKPINLNGLSPPPPPLSPQLPSLLLTFPGLPIPQQIPTSLPQSQNKQPEQYEQLGCGWDFLSQSCKDLFRVGWCQNCFDFGNQLMHDCRCIKVTNFYIQTTSFLGSSAASERANSAISSSLLSNRNIIINISTSPKPPSFGNFLIIL